MRLLYLDIDTLRADHLGCAGYHRDTTPNIDALAADGIRFADVYASDVPCLPSRTALATGTFGIRNGVVNHGGVAADLRPQGRDRGFTSLFAAKAWATQFYAAGWHTASISSFPFRHSASWWNHGFMEAMNLMRGFGGERADEVLPGALDWLDRNGRHDDWFLHVHFWDPHTPWDAPADFGEPFAGEPIPDWYTEDVRAAHWELPGPHSAQELVGYDARPVRLERALPAPDAGDPRHGRGAAHVRRLRHRRPLRRRRGRHDRRPPRGARRARRDRHPRVVGPRRGLRRARRVRRPPGRRRGDVPHPGRAALARADAADRRRPAVPPRHRRHRRRARRHRGAGRPLGRPVGRRRAARRRDVRRARPPGRVAGGVELPAIGALGRPPVRVDPPRRLPRLARRDALRRRGRPARAARHRHGAPRPRRRRPRPPGVVDVGPARPVVLPRRPDGRRDGRGRAVPLPWRAAGLPRPAAGDRARRVGRSAGRALPRFAGRLSRLDDGVDGLDQAVGALHVGHHDRRRRCCRSCRRR